jgi:Flp pilus assembly protein TadG
MRSDAGQATLEAIFVISLMFLPVLFGTVALARELHTWLVLQEAAAAGARVAATDGGDDAAVEQRIRQALGDGGLDATKASWTVSPSVADWGEPVTVQLSIPWSASLPLGPSFALNLQGSAVGRSEVKR